MEYILISACLLGLSCRYDGQSKEYEQIKSLLHREDITLVPVCPEQLGGLPTPRHPSERKDDKVVNDLGVDVTKEYQKGAMEALKVARLYHCKRAILKEKSPSCGCGQIYDGSFSRRLTFGDGVTAQLLKKNGIKVMGEKNLCRFDKGECL